MHAFEHKETGVVIHHHGDYSGEAILVIPKMKELEGQEAIEVQIPSRVLLAYAADYIQRMKIAALEEASDATLLGVPLPNG